MTLRFNNISKSRSLRSTPWSSSASAFSLELTSKIVTVLDCGIEDLLETVEALSSLVP